MIGWLHRHHLTHPLLALAMMIPFIVAGAPWAGAAFAIGFYFGREVRDAEVSLGMNFIRSLSSSGVLWAFQGFDVRRWSRDNHLDFWPVVLTALVAATLSP